MGNPTVGNCGHPADQPGNCGKHVPVCVVPHLSVEPAVDGGVAGPGVRLEQGLQQAGAPAHIAQQRPLDLRRLKTGHTCGPVSRRSWLEQDSSSGLMVHRERQLIRQYCQQLMVLFTPSYITIMSN